MADRQRLLPAERIEQRIFLVRGQRVMLSTHLAELYGVEPRVLVQAVKRNVERSPEDFMFQLTGAELANLKSQIVISSWGGARRATPYAFTEQGVAMLSSVLLFFGAGERSKSTSRSCGRSSGCARCLPPTRTWLGSWMNSRRNEKKYDAQFKVVFDAIRQLMTPPEPTRRRIGFRMGE